MDPQGIDIERVLGDFDRTRIEARGRIAAAPPFVTQATAQLGTTVQNRAITAAVTASGSLQQLQLHLQADDTAARATASGTLRAFDPVLFQRLIVDVESFDPSLWFSDVPSMQLRAAATCPLRPRQTARGRSRARSRRKQQAGPIDRDLLPLRSVRGTLSWSADTLKLDIERADGIRGNANGTLAWSRAEGVQATATVCRHRCHHPAQPCRHDHCQRPARL